MKIEIKSVVSSDTRRRAHVHAALGEPVRLALVERLSLGDESPSMLGDSLGLTTNLLAHHLRVLEQAGVVVRRRSEGDRRRTYVQLNIGDPEIAILWRTGWASAVSRIVFVCTQNSARSQLAAASWSAVSDVPVTSAGTRPAPRVHPAAVAVARRHGLAIGGAKPALVADVVRADDLVVAVCDNAYEDMSLVRPPLHWAIPDPVRSGSDGAFEAAYQQILARVGRLADAVQGRPS